MKPSKSLISTNPVSFLKLDVNQRTLVLVTSDGVMSTYDVANKENIELIDRVSVVAGQEKVTDITFLSSGLSIIVGSSSGAISQWGAVRDINNIYSLEKNPRIRTNARSYLKSST